MARPAVQSGLPPLVRTRFTPAGSSRAARECGIKRPVERDLSGRQDRACRSAESTHGSYVRAAVGRQHANHHSRGAGIQGGNDVALHYLQLVPRIAEVTGPRPHQHVDRDADLAGLLDHADARRDAVRLGQGCAELHPGGADGGSQPHGVLNRQLQHRCDGGPGLPQFQPPALSATLS
jgi:hypothetical protein